MFVRKKKVLDRLGFEPSTSCLRVSCSINFESQLLYQVGYRYYCGFNGMLLRVFFFNLLKSAN